MICICESRFNSCWIIFKIFYFKYNLLGKNSVWNLYLLYVIFVLFVFSFWLLLFIRSDFWFWIEVVVVFRLVFWLLWDDLLVNLDLDFVFLCRDSFRILLWFWNESFVFFFFFFRGRLVGMFDSFDDFFKYLVIGFG